MSKAVKAHKNLHTNQQNEHTPNIWIFDYGTQRENLKSSVGTEQITKRRTRSINSPDTD